MKRLLIALILLFTIVPAWAEANKNSVAIFYSDGKFRHVNVENLAELHRPGVRYVGMHLYRLEPGNPIPKLTRFNGRELVGISLRPATGSENRMIIIRRVDTLDAVSTRVSISTGLTFAQEWSLELDVPPNPISDTNFAGAAQLILFGSTVRFHTMPFNDDFYQPLVDCQADISKVNLRPQAVPTDGGYFDKLSGTCGLF